MPFHYSKPGFTKVTKKQLHVAQNFFKKHPDEIFLSRKDPRVQSHNLHNSFIYDRVTEKLYVKEDTHSNRKNSKKSYYLGSGSFGQVKFVQDLDGNLYALKISNPEVFTEKKIQKTYAIMRTLGKLFFIANKLSKTKKKLFLENTEFKKNVKEYHILKYEPGISLYEYLAEADEKSIDGNPISLLERLNIAINILLAVDEMHQRNLIHCDLSMNNIMIDVEAKAVGLIDFDRCMELSNERNAFQRNESIYDPVYYLANETTTQNVWTKQSDIYSIGAAFFHTESEYYTLFSAVEIDHYDILKTLKKDMLSFAFKCRPLAHEILDHLYKLRNKLENDEEIELKNRPVKIIDALSIELHEYLRNRTKNLYYTLSKMFYFFSNRAKRIDAVEQLDTDIKHLLTNNDLSLESIKPIFFHYKSSILQSRHFYERKASQGKNETIIQSIEKMFPQ